MTDLIEAVERAALADLHAAVDDELRRDLDLALHELGGALVSVAGALPASVVVNRVVGLGVGRPATEDDLEAIARIYEDAGVARHFVHLDARARPEALPEWLAARGWQKARGWMQFLRGGEPAPERTTDLRIEEVGAEQGVAFGRIVADAFDLGAVAAPWLARLPGRPGWRVLMAFAGPEPAATGALFVHRGTGWIDWDATAPAFRRRGAQGALLAPRITTALAMGCTVLATETGEAVPGDPQHSYTNILRAGFREANLRANYAPPSP